MSSCEHLDARDQARGALARLSGRPEVLGHDLVAPDVDPTGKWTVEIAIDADAIPPAVAEILSDQGLSIREAGPRAEWFCAVAVV